MKYPVASFVIGLVLGPIAETSLRQGLLISQYDLGAFLWRPITATLLIFSLLSLCYGLYGQFKRGRA